MYITFVKQSYEWTGLEFANSQRAVENRKRCRELVAKLSVVCPNDLYRKVKGEGAVPVLLNTKIALPWGR